MTGLLLGRICRTCLLECPTMHRLLDPKRETIQLEEMLNITVPDFDDLFVEMEDDMPLPVEMCNDCLEKLRVSYEFQQMCLVTNERLRDFFNQQEMKEVDLQDYEVTVNSELCRDNEISLLEDFKVEVNDELITDASHGYGNIAQTVKEEATSSTGCILGGIVEDIQKAESLSCDMAVTKDVAKYGDLSDAYSPSEVDDDNCESYPPIQMKKPVNRVKRKYVRRAPPRESSNKTCLVCKKVFKKRMFLTRHMSVHSLENQFVCEICQYRFATRKLLTLHNSREHCGVVISVEGGPYPCPDCPMIFEQTRALAAHRVMHLERDFNCEICGAYLKTLGAITRHMNCKHPGVFPYKCDMCEEAFPVKSRYNDHMNMHKGYKKHKCKICDKSFPNSTALKDHLRNHTGESPFLCSHCGKSFKTTNILRQHLQRHGEKNFKCPKCPMRFTVQSNLRQHMCTHSREKPHVCDICGSAFSRPDSLKTHKFKHSGVRPFKCDQCNLSFVFKAYLMRHKNRHTGEKPHSCSYCDRAYASSGDLVKHLRTHLGENTYLCDICPQTFKYQHDLRDHKNDEHYKEISEATNQIKSNQTTKTINNGN